MKPLVGLLIGALGFAGARGAHVLVEDQRIKTRADEPFAPSPASAPFVSLGYRELASDLLFFRLVGYFGGRESTGNGIASLIEAIVALDPHRYPVYEYGARAMTLARFGVDQSIYQRALAVLARGTQEFPPDWKLSYLAGQIYTQDLKTDDPAQRRAWDEAGTLLVESAIRKPGAPAVVATWAAHMRSKLGQYERAVTGLREMLLVTSDPEAQQRILEKLSELENQTVSSLASELLETRRKFVDSWRTQRPALPGGMFVLLGPHPSPRFDMADLATGGLDFYGTETIERLEPVE